MIQFGEKIKQLREQKGMTQQALAEMLYVTRQAVSRWECGARYPDLLTAKKIAQILNTSIDELLSGEELKSNIEKEPVLAKPVENMIQTVLYTIAVITYLLMCIFSFYSIIVPNQSLSNTPAGTITFLEICVILGHVLNASAVCIGLILSVRNRLVAKITGCLMCTPYLISASHFLVTYIDMQIRKNGVMDIRGWITGFVLPLTYAICILFFFLPEERRMPYIILLMISLLTLFEIAYGYRHRLLYCTDLGFVVGTVHCLGKLGMVILLAYQAYILERKKRKAYKVIEEHFD